ncbi:MAG: hypothetical protein OHK93_000674, partial [Ramalina farinacea]|nr:hypothetical protein [Ramalina farinacea]
MTIKTSEGMIRVHKDVFCLTSPVIAKAMEGQFVESQEDCFDLSHEDPEIISRFVEFCYLSRYETVERVQQIGFDLSLTKDDDGIVQYIGPTAVQRPNLPILSRSSERGASSRLPPRPSPTARGPDAQESAKKTALILNAARLRLDVSMWAMGDLYDVQHLKSYAVGQLNTRLSALWEQGNSPSLILDIVQPVYECTFSINDDLRIMLVQSLRKFKRAIGREPLLRSRFEALTKSNNELMTDL